MKTLFPKPARCLRSMISAVAGFSVFARADEPQAPDFFEIAVIAPADLAGSVARPASFGSTEHSMTGFVGLPMSGEHRREFMEALRANLSEAKANKLFPALCLANLLEEDGRFDDALVLLRTEVPESKQTLVRQVGLLWKAGKAAEARELAGRIPDSSSFDEAWLSLVGIDLIKNRPEEALRMLGFLETLTALRPQVRHALALQHLVIARRGGNLENLFAFTPSPVLRAVWHAALDREKQALECVAEAGPGLSAGEIGMLALALHKDGVVFERAKALLNAADLPVNERRSLLLCFSDTRQRFDLWSAMKSGHGETADLLELISSLAGSDQAGAIRRICLEKVKAKPDDARLKWLAVQASAKDTDESQGLLREIARSVREKPEGNSSFADPAKNALEILVRSSKPEELRALLFEAPGFANLPAHAKLRYLMAADLDFEVVNALVAHKFDQAGEDGLGGSLLGYFSRRAPVAEIPAEVTTLLMHWLPQIVIGSPSKPQYSRRSDANSWLTFLGSNDAPEDRLADTVYRLVEAAGQNGAETRQAVVAGLPGFVWSLPGVTITRPEKTAPRAAPPPTPHFVLSMFAPPDAAKFGQNDLLGAMPQGLDHSHVARLGDGGRFLINSPWTENLRGIQGQGRFDSALQAKLRPLFESQPSRTLIYDLLVAAGKINCPDPAVKASAEQRIAKLSSAREDDPAIALFLFHQRWSKRTPLEECLPLLEGLMDFPRPARLRALRPLHPAMTDQRLAEAGDAIREKLGFDPPPEAPKPPQPQDNYDRLQFFIEAGKQASPEAVALAKEVLFAFPESRREDLWSTENIAISILASAGNFTAFLDELRARMKAVGRSEVELQRALFRLHRYRIIHSKGESLPFARRVFELDPADTQAAAEVLAAAAREGDAALALKCLEALCRHSGTRLLAALDQRASSYSETSAKLLDLFKGAKARELSETLLRCPFPPDPGSGGYRPSDSPTLQPLYLHAAVHDPENLMPLLRWAGALTPAKGTELLRLADELKRVRREDAAVALLAEAFFAVPDAGEGGPLRFRNKSADVLPNSNTFPLSTIVHSGWAKRLAEASAAYPQSASNAGIRLLIELAADPRPETWDRLVPGFLESIPIATRPEVRRQLVSQVGQLPGSAALQIRLAQEGEAGRQDPLTLSSIQQKLRLAAQAGDRSQVQPLWTAAKELLGEAPERNRLDFLSAVANDLAYIAEAAVWKEFVEAAKKTEGFAADWIRRSGDLWQRDVVPARIEDLARLALPPAPHEPGNRNYLLRFFAPLSTTENPDLDLLKQFRPWIEENDRRPYGGPRITAGLQWLDLLNSDLSAVCPVVDGQPMPDGTWSVAWSLAGIKGMRSGHPAARAFPFLDGQFDLEILAGPAPERLRQVSFIPQVAGTGQATVKLPEDAKYLVALARQSSGDIVRWSHPVELSRPGDPVALVPFATGKPGGEIAETVIPAGGPFGTADARDFVLPAGTGVELARLAWNEGAAPEVSGWVLESADAGSISLSFRNGDDVEIESRHLGVGDYELDSLPFWQRFKTPSDLMAPPETVTVALVFKPGSHNRPTRFRISDVRAVPPPPVLLPEGFSALGRIPGSVETFALDTQGNRIAVSSRRSGVGVFDFATKQFSGWIPLDENEGSTGLVWIALAGDRLVALARTGELHLVTVSRRTARVIRKTDDLTDLRDDGLRPALSPDGNFFAWRGIMAGLRVAKLGDEGISSERLFETAQLHGLRFNPEKNVIEAQGDGNVYSLPLADWEKAELKVEGAHQGHFQDFPPELYRPGTRWLDSRHDITFEVASNGNPPVEIQSGSRTITLPNGLVTGDREGRPFFISRYGRVMRIETAKLKGYVPPGTK